nr:probable glycosyltransferase At3g07620 [Ipomoea batatas]
MVCIILVVVRAKGFREPARLSPWFPSHFFTDFVVVVDAEGRNAAPLVKPGTPLHDFHFVCCLFENLLHVRKLEFVDVGVRRLRIGSGRPLWVRGSDEEYEYWNMCMYIYYKLTNLQSRGITDMYLNKSLPLANVFLPHPDSSKQRHYFSEHMFKVALLRSSVQTRRPEDALFLFMPFSINGMPNHPDLQSVASISDFVAGYSVRVNLEFEF